MNNQRLTRSIQLSLLFAASLSLSVASNSGPEVAAPHCESAPQVCLKDLAELAVPAMRSRSYRSQFKLLEKVDYREDQLSYMLAYSSDELRLYSRLDLPSSSASAPLPVVVIAPGWIGRQQAIAWDFGLSGSSSYSAVIDHFVHSGFAVVTVGYRGRGTVKGVPADGMVYRDAWGNGSYVSPLFYARDLLNLLAGLNQLPGLPWKQWLPATTPAPGFDLSRVSVWAHSQGGDVALTALAVAGNNREFTQPLWAASIWSGNIADRFTQVDTFEAMATTTEAFFSGDGSWTGSAVGRKGEINPDFVFPWPADWIGTVDTGSPQWTWQAEQWSTATVAAARERKYGEMYASFNRYVENLAEASFSMSRDSTGKSIVRHHPEVSRVVPALGGFNHAGKIQAPLALHISDRDYYSLPEWNRDLAARINTAGGSAQVYLYPGNTHALKKSEHAWFSPEGTIDGAPIALARDVQLFRAANFAQ